MPPGSGACSSPVGASTANSGVSKKKPGFFRSTSDVDDGPQSAYLTFSDVVYTTADGGAILHGVSGVITPGEVTAIMGASGSGKTSLLQILAGQRIPTSGELALNGTTVGPSTKRHIGMLPQEDVILPTVTVEEAMRFSADLRLPATVTKEEKRERVDMLITALGLEKVRHSRIGDTRRRKGISGGEKKRCSIGVEMVHEPRVLLLDEPTSGLDSATTHQLLAVLRELARKSNVAVAFTIHQPSNHVFDHFDKLLLLSCGRCAYFGAASGALDHFKSLGHACPPLTNPAEFLLDLVTGTEIGPEEAARLPGLFDQSPARTRLDGALSHALACGTPLKRGPKEGSFVGRAAGWGAGGQAEETFATSFWQQFRVLLSRAWINTRRNPVSTHAASGRSITMGLIVGFLFYNVGLGQRSVQDRTGALYFVLTTQIFSAQGSMRVFLEERDLFLRERIAGAYRTSAYFWSKSIADTPLQLLFALIFSVMSYFLVGLQPGLLHFLKYCLAVVITTLAAESYVIMVGAWVPDDKTAAILGPVAFALMSLFGGFFLNIDSLPFFVAWLQYLSLFKYSFAAIMQNEFRGLKFTCDEEDSRTWLETLDDSTRAHVEEFIHLLPCPTPDGETHLHRLKLDQIGVWPCIFSLALIAVLFRVLGFVALRRRSRALMSGQQKERRCPVLPRNRGAKKPEGHPKQG